MRQIEIDLLEITEVTSRWCLPPTYGEVPA